jgi:hypothetical protein
LFVGDGPVGVIEGVRVAGGRLGVVVAVVVVGPPGDALGVGVSAPSTLISAAKSAALRRLSSFTSLAAQFEPWNSASSSATSSSPLRIPSQLASPRSICACALDCEPSAVANRMTTTIAVAHRIAAATARRHTVGAHAGTSPLMA